MESKNTTNFEAKTEQNINYPADFGGLSRAIGKFFWPGTNFMCSAITKLEFWVFLEPPRISTSGENCRYVVGAIYAPPCKIGLNKISGKQPREGLSQNHRKVTHSRVMSTGQQLRWLRLQFLCWKNCESQWVQYFIETFRYTLYNHGIFNSLNLFFSKVQK